MSVYRERKGLSRAFSSLAEMHGGFRGRVCVVVGGIILCVCVCVCVMGKARSEENENLSLLLQRCMESLERGCVKL